jgi:sn-glycerol 3-phosphate transport system permease protein
VLLFIALLVDVMSKIMTESLPMEAVPASPKIGLNPTDGQNRPRKSIWRVLLPYLLILPTFTLVFIFTLWPTGQSVISSLYRPPLTVRQQEQFVGLQNYVDLFDAENTTRPDISSTFPKVLVNTLVFTFATVAICVPLAFAFALLLNRKLRRLGLWRFSLFYPSLLPLIGAASIWAFLFADTIGLTNTVLRSFGIPTVKWIGLPGVTLFSVIIVIVWKQVGYFMIFYLAGLQSIPREIYEAAELEGANGWQQTLYLTIPLLRRTTLFILVIASTYGFQMVEQLQALGLGGPNDTSNLILYYIFQKFSEPRNWGYVNAMTVVLLVILMVFTAANFYFFEWRRLKNDD